MAEEFGARPDSPQIACLQGVRESDLVVLILGARYGAVQPASGLSPTHEEFREARERKPVLVFVQEGAEREAKQQEFVTEVQAWSDGYFRGSFRTVEELRGAVTRAIYDYVLANATGPVNTAELVEAAEAQIPRSRRNQHSGAAVLRLSIVGGPLQRLLRPSELEAPGLAEFIQREALFGSQRIFEKSRGTDDEFEGDVLVLQQEGGASVRLAENGSVLLSLPLEDNSGRRTGFSLFYLIEETVLERLSAGLGFANVLLDRIDPTQRLAQIAVAATIEASDFMGWRTQAEQDASPNSGTMQMGGGEELSPVQLQIPRPKLRLAVPELAEDLKVKLRRQRTGEPRRR
jgi:hypothetical protein